MTAIKGLGCDFDIVMGIEPVDLQNAQTGNRVLMSHAGGCTVLVIKDAGTAADDPTLDLRQHNAASGGTSKDLDIIDTYYVKSETTLDGDEAWTEVTQTAASEIADPGGAGTSAEEEQLVAIHVDAADMDIANGFKWLSLDIADVGSNAQLGAVVYILTDLAYPAAPANLPATQ